MDPYVVNQVYFEYNRGKDIHGNLVVKNAKTSGLSRTKIEGVRSEINETAMTIEIDVHFPKLVMEGKYSGEGAFNHLQFKSKGYFNVTQSK